MAFSLRQTHKKNDIYLQIYENYWDKELKQPRNRHIESLGYVSDLISEDIPDPVVHFKAVVENMNRQRTEEFDEKTRPRAFTANVEKNVGYFTLYGTSMAAPYVAGVAALIKSCHPNITTTQLKNAILNNGDSCSSLSGYCVTGCRLNAYNALHSIHSFTSYVDYGNAFYHKKACSICGLHGTTLSLHIWIPNTLHTKYTCNKCGATTTNPSLPREE